MAARGLDFDQYVANLSSNGLCDGLELWLVSVLTGKALNIVQEDSIWCTVRTGVDLKEYSTLMLTGYGQAVWCRTIQESSEDPIPEVDTILSVAPVKKLPGRCITQRLSPGLTSPSSHASLTETETELLMEALDKCVKLPPDPGTVKE